MLTNNIHSLATDEQAAVRAKLGQCARITIVKIEAGGPIIEAYGKRYMLVDMDDCIEVQEVKPEQAIRLPRSYKRIDDMLG